MREYGVCVQRSNRVQKLGRRVKSAASRGSSYFARCLLLLCACPPAPSRSRSRAPFVASIIPFPFILSAAQRAVASPSKLVFKGGGKRCDLEHAFPHAHAPFSPYAPLRTPSSLPTAPDLLPLAFWRSCTAPALCARRCVTFLLGDIANGSTAHTVHRPFLRAQSQTFPASSSPLSRNCQAPHFHFPEVRQRPALSPRPCPPSPHALPPHARPSPTPARITPPRRPNTPHTHPCDPRPHPPAPAPL